MNARKKSVDTTYLSLDNAEERGFIHRDYIAHCFRWSHVVKRLMQKHSYKDAVLLDIGCGRELPLAKLLYTQRMWPLGYHGVDVGSIDEEAWEMVKHLFIKISEHQDAAILTPEQVEYRFVGGTRLPNWVVCFECFEHIEADHLKRLLLNLKKITAPDAQFFFSTPCWDRVNTAGNHVNEITYEALGAMLETMGFEIVAQYGTFASIKDYWEYFTPEEQKLAAGLREYYDSNVLSVIFAPMFPGLSRNCLWHCCWGTMTSIPKFKKLRDCRQPWGSGKGWEAWL